MLDRKYLFGTTIVAGLFAAAMFSAPAAAQEAKPATKPSESKAEAEGDVSALIVTGSRIKRNEFTSSSPIQVITAEQASLEGLVDTAEILQQSSIASGSFQVNSQLVGTIQAGQEQITLGANYISLRGLGANRTLVLLNGRRVGPAGVSGAIGPVDLSVIPQSIIERQDILKDGASSIYGSDAVSGVINIITRNNLDGGAMTIYGNQPFKSGGERFQINGSYGKTFDRGSFSISADWLHREALLRKDRDYLRCTENVFFDPTSMERVDQRLYDGSILCNNITNNALQVVDNVNNRVLMYDVPGRNFGGPKDGNDSPVVGMQRVNRAGYPVTFQNADLYLDTPLYGEEQVINPLDRYSVFGTGTFDITGKVQAYGELLLSRRETEANSISNVGPGRVINSLNQTQQGLPASNPNNLMPNGAPFGFSVSVFAPRTLFSSQTVDYGRIVGGLRGDIGDLGFLSDLSWDFYVQHSRSDGEYKTQFVYTDRLTAVSSPGVACTDNPLGIGNLSNFKCADLNGGAGIPWTSARILAGQFNDQERAFLFGVNTGTTKYEQTSAEASATGTLFTLPAGPVGAAIGFSWRKDKINDDPGENALARNMYNFTTAGVTKGTDTVKEVYGELNIPIVRDIPAIQNLTLNVSGRYSDYDSYGSNSTYKVGLNWQIVPAFRLRGSYGTSFRAPALFEQFIGSRTAFTAQSGIDPCINWASQANTVIQQNCQALGIPDNYTGIGVPSATVLTKGGRDVLKPETSDSLVVGAIWTPSFVDLSVAVEYFEYNIQDEIRTFGAANILFQCMSRTDFPNNPFCSLFQRTATPTPTDFGITTVDNSYINVASQKNRGIDLTFRYQHDFEATKLTVDGQFTWTMEDTTQLLGSSEPEDFNGGTGEPDFSGQFNVRLDRGDWTFNWNMDLLGKASDTDIIGTDLASSNATYNVTCTFTPTGGSPSVGPCSSFRGPTGALLTPGSLAVNSQTVYRKLYNEFSLYHSISLTRRWDDWTFRAGIQNLFDEDPPLAGSGLFRKGVAAMNAYDVLGRRAWISISKTF